MIKIIADSTCDLTKKLIEEYDIQIVPLHIVLGKKDLLDGIEITPDEIYAWADENEDTPKTSAIGFEETSEILKQTVGANDEAIVFAVSGKMSTTANVFRLVVEDLELEDRITIIDSENLSTGIGLLILKACDMIKEGKSRTEICYEINKLKSKVQASFVVDTLTYLHRGGRCSSVAALAGGMLKLHPKIVVTNGSMIADKKYRGKIEKVIIDYIKDMENSLHKAESKRIFITHSGCDQEIINKVHDYLRDLNCFEEILITRAGGVISSHCGPGTLGVLYLNE